MSDQELQERLARLDRVDGELGDAVKELRQSILIMAEVQRLQAEALQENERRAAEHKERMRHIEMNLAEFTDKLNGLIGYLDNWRREPPSA